MASHLGKSCSACGRGRRSRSQSATPIPGTAEAKSTNPEAQRPSAIALQNSISSATRPLRDKTPVHASALQASATGCPGREPSVTCSKSTRRNFGAPDMSAPPVQCSRRIQAGRKSRKSSRVFQSSERGILHRIRREVACSSPPLRLDMRFEVVWCRASP